MTHSNQNMSINCRGKVLDLTSPVVMGIINVNNDSFYSSSRATKIQDIVQKVHTMQQDGAQIIDLGAMSSKPGSQISIPEDEIKVLLPIIKVLLDQFPDIIISIDTIHSMVAEKTIEVGASIINDISAGDFDKNMIATISKLNVPYIMMHKKGMPADMQDNPQYDDVLMEVMTYFIKKVAQARDAGIMDVIIDPGFGFGKTIDHNYTLLKSLEVFQILNVPILAGISRKSMIYKYLDTDADHALNGTTALHMIALQKGSKILRVHDVKEAMECIRLYEKIKN